MKINKMSLFTKMFILLFLSTSIPLSILGYFAYSKSNEQLETVASVFLRDHLQQNSERLSYFMDSVNEYSESVLASQRLHALLKEQHRETFNEISFMNAMSSLLSVFHAPYDVQIYPIRIERFPNYVRKYTSEAISEKTDWFVKARQMEGKGFWYIASPDSSTEPKLFYIRLIRSFSDLQHEGVLSIAIPNQLVLNQLILPSTYKNFQLTLMDADHTNIFAKKATSSESPALFHDINPFVNEDEFRRIKTREGTSMYLASQAVGPDGWRLVEAVPVRDLTGPLDQIKGYPFSIFLIAVPVITFFLIWITRHFTVPLGLLAALMKKAQRGEFRHVTNYVNRSDEVGYLMRGYNSMITGMKNLLHSTRTIEREKKNYEIQMLMTQINPHFLYNTLESIKWQANAGHSRHTSDMVQSLVNMLRFSLNDGRAFTTLEREINHTKSYLNIELIRHNYAFEIFYQIPAHILNASCLKLIIQPIVENAVRHGMQKLKPGTGKIIIQIYAVEQVLYCRVVDNGPGCDAAEINRRLNDGGDLATEHGGIGLFNVHRRLRLEFGAPYGIELSSSGEGTTVVIKSPFRQK